MKGHNSKRRYYAWRMNSNGLKDAGSRERAEQTALIGREHEKDTSNVRTTGNGLTRNKRKKQFLPRSNDWVSIDWVQERLLKAIETGELKAKS